MYSEPQAHTRPIGGYSLLPDTSRISTLFETARDAPSNSRTQSTNRWLVYRIRDTDIRLLTVEVEPPSFSLSGESNVQKGITSLALVSMWCRRVSGAGQAPEEGEPSGWANERALGICTVKVCGRPIPASMVCYG